MIVSFEGYYQRLCKNGHSMDVDVYLSKHDDRCRECNAEVVWQNLVDQTNDGGNPVRLKIKEQHECDHCGTILETKYELPTPKGDHE